MSRIVLPRLTVSVITVGAQGPSAPMFDKEVSPQHLWLVGTQGMQRTENIIPLVEKGSNLDQTTEAVHVASAVRGGANLLWCHLDAHCLLGGKQAQGRT